MKVTLKGFREMDAALGEFSKATAKNILLRTGLAALEPVAALMRANVPVESGDLKEAVDVGAKRAKRTSKHFAEPHVVEVYAGVAVKGRGMPPQAIQQEFGNENHGPQAFVRPGWDAGKDDVPDHLKASLGTEIDKATQRARRKALKAGR